MSARDAALVAAWIMIVLLFCAVTVMLRLVMRVLAENTRNRPIEQQRGRTHLELPNAGRAVVGWIVLFVDEHCASCTGLLAELSRFEMLARPGADLMPLVVMCRGQCPDIDADLRSRIAVIEDAPEQFDALGIRLTPYAARLDSDGVLISGAPIGSYKRFLDFAEVAHEEVLKANANND